jgi:photosystem I P700 chlorophyll a apoprotein A1
MVISDYSFYWFQPFHFDIVLSKSVQTSKTTIWIWNLHAIPHDFSIQGLSSQSMVSQMIDARKVISANISHIFLLCLFITGLHYNGAYFSNYCLWIKDPQDMSSCSQIIWNIIGQDILNTNLGDYFEGYESTTGIYNLWRTSGCITQSNLKYTTCCSLITRMMSFILGYFYMHCFFISTFITSIQLVQHIIILIGLGSLGWTGHCIHIAKPMNGLLDSGIDPISI